MPKNMIIFLCIFAVSLTAVEIPFNRNPLEVSLETKGGGISRLVRQGHRYSAPGVSFTERVMSNTMRDGKEAVLQYLVGQTMRLSRGKANPQLVMKLLREQLTK